MPVSNPKAANDSAGVGSPGKSRPLISFENVTKRFGTFTALDNVSLDIFENEFFALLGPSGCGKTTLMRLLAGFESPTEGRVCLGGQDLAGIPPHQRPVNMMFQSYALFPHLSVERNIAFGLRQEGLPTDKIAARVARMLDLVQLRPFAKRKPHQLSGGQRQRVALARSIIKQPKVLLLDEPLGALDKKLREETQFELMNLQEDLGITFMIVTHDQEEAMTVADRMAVMSEGRLAQVDTPHAIYEEPASRYVARFVGDINMLEGRMENAPGPDGHLTLAMESISIHAISRTQIDPGTRVWLAIRPEKISISKSEPQTDGNRLRGVVEDVAYRGGASLFQVRLTTGQVLKIFQTNRLRASEDTITWDDTVWLSWPREAGVVLTR